MHNSVPADSTQIPLSTDSVSSFGCVVAVVVVHSKNLLCGENCRVSTEKSCETIEIFFTPDFSGFKYLVFGDGCALCIYANTKP